MPTPDNWFVDAPVDRPPRHKRRLTAGVAAMVVALDAATKAVAVHFLAGRGEVSVLGGAFYLDLYRNFAGPRNTFTGHPVFVSVMAMIAVTALALLATRVRTTMAAVGVGLLLGGGTGNLLDRLLSAPGPLRGGVVDWLRPSWSAGSMNLADLSIVAGLLLVLAGTAAGWWRTRSHATGSPGRGTRDQVAGPAPATKRPP